MDSVEQANVKTDLWRSRCQKAEEQNRLLQERLNSLLATISSNEMPFEELLEQNGRLLSQIRTAEQERDQAMNAGAIMEKLLRQSTETLLSEREAAEEAVLLKQSQLAEFVRKAVPPSSVLRSIADRLTDRLKVGVRDRAWAGILTGLADEIDEVKTKIGDLQPQPASLPSASPEEK